MYPTQTIVANRGVVGADLPRQVWAAQPGGYIATPGLDGISVSLELLRARQVARPPGLPDRDLNPNQAPLASIVRASLLLRNPIRTAKKPLELDQPTYKRPRSLA